MQRDGFACSNCGDSDSELHVHHILYSRGKSPWDYDDDHLKTLCKECHSSEEEIRNQWLELSGRTGEAPYELLRALDNMSWNARFWAIKLFAFAAPDEEIMMGLAERYDERNRRK